MSYPINRSLAEHIRALSQKEYSSLELTEAYLSRIEQADGALGAFLSLDPEGARKSAKEADERRSRGDTLSPLAGIPVALKDNLCATGLPTTCGSRILEGYRPPFDATAVAGLRQAGAVILGKTNMDEFGMGSTTEHSAFHITKNPLGPSLVPGGSSGGSAAAVAALEVPLALGTDTGGSVRQPAAFCGICGMRPTYGAVSRYGLVAYASSLDQIGPLTRTVEDNAIALEAILGKDERDATSHAHPTPYLRERISEGVRGLRVGLIREVSMAPMTDEVRAALTEAADTLCRLGATVAEVSVPSLSLATAIYGITSSAEASSNLARFDGVRYGRRAEGQSAEEVFVASRSRGFGKEVKRRILLGTYVLGNETRGDYYEWARKGRALLRRELSEVLSRVDLLLLPTAPTPPYALNEKTEDPVLRVSEDLFCLLAALCGLPSLALPFGQTEKGLPLSVQLMGKPFDEATLYRAGFALEAEKPNRF